MTLSNLGLTLLFSLRCAPSTLEASSPVSSLGSILLQLSLSVRTFLADPGRGSVGESKVAARLPLRPSSNASSGERVTPEQRSLVAKAFPSSPVGFPPSD